MRNIMPAPRSIRIIGLAVLIAAALLAGAILAARAQTAPQDQLQQGAELYAQFCAVCHGENGMGRVGATLAKDWPSVRPDLDIRNTIANGVQNALMPAWSQAKGGPLTDQEIDALVAYIMTWGNSGAPKFTPAPTYTALPPVTPLPDIEGDTTSGAALFQQNCIMCHGEGGQGKIGKTLAKDWPSVRPDLFISNTIANGVLNTAMPAWSQAKGGPLSDQEIGDLTAYILALPKVTQVQPTTEPAAPEEPSWLSGWGGVVIFLVILVGIIALILYIQTRSKRSADQKQD
jgi:mono/diheme cytochrome c family protein